MCFSGSGGGSGSAYGATGVAAAPMRLIGPILSRLPRPVGAAMRTAVLRGGSSAEGLGRGLATGNLRGGVKAAILGATSNNGLDDNT